ncbi:MAG: molybdenum cofactor guanylyltransferase [Acidimicrobiia bacterium]|nr:molybdenum cofactor guanylyltransferase [Acidimicrobiia bacterium]MYG59243.1 molybdenum cofactor guanylyltransferase [Acidimicrobiia bacterium]MYJ33914.1 molybdenum cofactor guanylyltransferase [Acidimicrobiia bacterium]
MAASEDLPQFTGAVLAGGKSQRMGTDKAFIEVGGTWLITRALEALSGASQRLIVGGTDPKLVKAASAAHAQHVADRWPGEGPLGAVATALGLANHPVTVILPCDLPAIKVDDVAALVQAVRAAPPAAAPLAAVFTDERRHYLPLAVDTSAAALATRLFESGQRAVASLLEEAAVFDVPAPPLAVADIDSPEDL